MFLSCIIFIYNSELTVSHILEAKERQKLDFFPFSVLQFFVVVVATSGVAVTADVYVRFCSSRDSPSPRLWQKWSSVFSIWGQNGKICNWLSTRCLNTQTRIQWFLHIPKTNQIDFEYDLYMTYANAKWTNCFLAHKCVNKIDILSVEIFTIRVNEMERKY